MERLVGKGNRRGYHYHPFMLTVNHLAILQAYYLYRQFPPQQVLAIRSDCIYVQGDLPPSILASKDKYHLAHYQQVSFSGDSNIFIHDCQELKSFAQGSERKELANFFLLVK